MIRRQTTLTTVLAMVAGLLVPLAAASPAAAHRHPAYSNDGDVDTRRDRWMTSLPDVLRLSDLSIPGTHDSGAYVFGREVTETQAKSFSAQLAAGIRAFDIRLGRNLVCGDSGGTKLWIFHGSQCQSIEFSDVVRGFKDFLDANPGETLVLRIKKDAGSDDGFFEILESTMAPLQEHFYNGEDSNPTLGELRGKVYVLDDFPGTYDQSVLNTLSWLTPDTQDNFDMGDNWDLADKWRDVRDQFRDADDTSTEANSDKLHINFLSAAGGGFPYFFASGHSSWETGAPRLLTGWTRGVIDTCSGAGQCLPEYPSVNCFLGTCSVAFEGVNTMAYNFINSRVQQRTGVVMADFPGDGLIQAIIDVNSRDANNVPPVIGTIDDVTIKEGDKVELVVPYTDADAQFPEEGKVSIDWGDGSEDSRPAAMDPREKQAVFEHVYVNDPPGARDVYDVFVLVGDADRAVATTAVMVEVANLPPTLTSVVGSTVPLGTTSTVVATVEDPGIKDDLELVVNWGDGAPEQRVPAKRSADQESAEITLEHDYASGGAYQVTVVAHDGDGGEDSRTETVVVEDTSPGVSATGSSIDENGTATVSGTIDDPGDPNSHSLVVDWGDGSGPDEYPLAAGVATFDVTHQYLDDNPTGTATDSYRVQVEVTNDAGDSDSTVTNVQVRNVAPAVTAMGSSVDEGGQATVSGTISDPGTLDSFEVTIDWGDGSTPAVLSRPAGATTFEAQHVYVDDDPSGTPLDDVPVWVSVVDDDNGMGQAETAVTVSNVAPTVQIAAVESVLGAVLVGVPTRLAGSYSDRGEADTHTASVDWADGTTDSADLDGATGAVEASHVYREVGSYDLVLTITDDDTGVGTAEQTVEVMAPSSLLDDVITQLRGLVDASPDDPALREALRQLVGSANGRGANGADDLLDNSAVVPAMERIADSIEALAQAGNAGVDTEMLQQALGSIAWSLASLAVDDLVESLPDPTRGEQRRMDRASALLEDGVEHYLSGDYLSAVRAFQQVVQRA